jgi:hypothetical protein
MQKLPIGLSDFKELRRRNYYFVDKSELISEIINENNKVVLIPRPRRFGKTLNLSMLRYFFDINEDAKGLFKGLKIENLPEFEHQGKYPVIFLTFKDIKEPDFNAFLTKLSELIADLYKIHQKKLLNHDLLDQRDKNKINDILLEKKDYTLLQNSLKNLSRYLSEIYQINPIILLDEYDTPIHAGWLEGYYDEVIKFMRGFLSGVFKDNIYFEKGVITGCLRVAKESIFTGMNNLTVASILTRLFDDYFGFTPEETLTLLQDYNQEKKYKEIMNWYNGYQFGDKIVLNPWSVLNAVAYQELRPYWANTSSNDLIRMLVEEGPSGFKQDITLLLNGETIESVIDENIVFPDLKNSIKYIYSLLFFSGYLRCEKKENIKGTIKCKLVIPNIEIEYIFENIISNWVEKGFQDDKLKQMYKALIDGNIEEFELILNDFVITTLSYFDAKGQEPEAVYLGFIAGMLVGLGSEYSVKTNRESGYGRYDVMVKPRDKNKQAIIMELKSVNKTRHKDFDKSIQEALKQIEDRAYAKELQAEGYNNILKLAIVSDGKLVRVQKG